MAFVLQIHTLQYDIKTSLNVIPHAVTIWEPIIRLEKKWDLLLKWEGFNIRYDLVQLGGELLCVSLIKHILTTISSG